MTEEVEVSEGPDWLKELEAKRERRLKARLGHEAGAGAPCLNCDEKCPGLDLHFWRKICKNCKCSKEDHDVHDDDIYGWAQFQLLGSKPSKIKHKIVLPGKKDEVELEWTPKGQTETVAKFLKTLPPELLPVKGSRAAQERKQMLQKQIPIHDIDPTLCHELTASELSQMNEYIAHMKQNSVGVGNIIQIGMHKGGLHSLGLRDATLLAERYPKGIPASELVKLQAQSSSNVLSKKFAAMALDKNPDSFEKDRRENYVPKTNLITSETRFPANFGSVKDVTYPSNKPLPPVAGSRNLPQLLPDGISAPADVALDPYNPHKIKDISYPINENQIVNQGYINKNDGSRNLPTNSASGKVNPSESQQYPYSPHVKTHMYPHYQNSVNDDSRKDPGFSAEKTSKGRPNVLENMYINEDDENRMLPTKSASGKFNPVESEQYPYNPHVKSHMYPHYQNTVDNDGSLNENSQFLGDKTTRARPNLPNYVPNVTNVSENIQNPSETSLNSQHYEHYVSNDNTLNANDQTTDEDKLKYLQKQGKPLPHLAPSKLNTYKDTQNPLKVGNFKDLAFSTFDPEKVGGNEDFPIYNDDNRNALQQEFQNIPPNQYIDDQSPLKMILKQKYGDFNQNKFETPTALQDIDNQGGLTNYCQVPDKCGNSNNYSSDKTNSLRNMQPGDIDNYRDQNYPHAEHYPKTLPSLKPSNSQILESQLDPQNINVGPINDLIYQVPEIKSATNEQNPVHHDMAFEPYSHIPNLETLPICHRCKKAFEQNEFAVHIEQNNALFHPSCLKCAGCNQILADMFYFYDKKSDELYCLRDYAKIRGIPRCNACDELIFVKEYTLAENKTFHVKHFCCFECDEPLAGKNYVMEETQPVCVPCFEKLKANVCKACSSIIKPEEQGANLNGVHFHASDTCFACKVCKNPLLGAKLMFKNENLYCSPDCFRSDQ